MKYIIELTPIEGTDLYRAKGANTLVFDENGIKNILMPYRKRKVKRWETYDGNFERAKEDWDAMCKSGAFKCSDCDYHNHSWAHNTAGCFAYWLMEEIEVEE